MNILSINTAFADIGISLMKDDKLVANYYSVCKKRSEHLIYSVLDDLLNNVTLSLNEIDLYVVAQGPGSYTSLRVGMAVTKTFGQVYQTPVVAVNSLELLASMAEPLSHPFYVLLNCTRSEIFYARFQLTEAGLQQIDDIQLTTLENLWKTIKDQPVVLQRTITNFKLSSPLFDQLSILPLRYPIVDAYPLLSLGTAYFHEYSGMPPNGMSPNGNFPIVNPIYIKKDA